MGKIMIVYDVPEVSSSRSKFDGILQAVIHVVAIFGKINEVFGKVDEVSMKVNEAPQVVIPDLVQDTSITKIVIPHEVTTTITENMLCLIVVLLRIMRP